MLLDLTFLAVGALALAFAGDRLVDFAAAIAEKARLTPAVIGLTIVAAGTSAPELVVSVTAALRDSPAIAVGNVVGSNIANIGLVLAACAAVTPVPVTGSVLRFEYPFLLLVSWITLLLSRDGSLDRLEAAFFVASMAAFVAYAVAMARRIEPADRSAVSEVVPAGTGSLSRKPATRLALGLLTALVGLVVAGYVFVAGAVGLAQRLGVSERVIGLTVVAVGTSLPELAVSLAAAMKKQQEMAVANIVGSNIFNLLMILGTTGLVRPLVAADVRMVLVDMWVMMAFAVLLLPLIYRRRTLSRAGGAFLLTAYAAYVAWLVAGAR